MVYLDARGLSCPLPLLKTKLALKAMEKGETLDVLASDSGSFKDIPVYLEQTEHKLLVKETQGDDYHFIIEC
ncbi:MAG: sulfurtransferase TusA family protein [Cellvibrionales bacterium]|nr:sulfurtransferase TusA family protein [Cellvibrionales bacterium]